MFRRKRGVSRRDGVEVCSASPGSASIGSIPASSSLTNYSADAGAGSNTIIAMSDSSGLRAALLGTAAAGALWLGLPRAAKAGPDACDVSVAGVATCQGDQSAGITSAGSVPPNFDPATTTTLNVNTLTTNIAPATNVDGIYFHRSGAGDDIVINVDTTNGPNGIRQIIVNGAAADGIDAEGADAITIMQTGNIDATRGRDGIRAQTTGLGSSALNIMSDRVAGGETGIHALHAGNSSLQINAYADVVGRSAFGIYAKTTNIGSTGIEIITKDVRGGGTAIYALHAGNSLLEIGPIGEVVGIAGDGIFARTTNIGSTGINIVGEDVSGGGNGIFALHAGNSLLNVDVADVHGASADGIYARTTNIGSTGLAVVSQDVTGGGNGIFALHAGNSLLSISAEDVQGSTGDGIYARNTNIGSTGLTIVSEDVIGGGNGIFAVHSGNSLLSIAAGEVLGRAADGIYAKTTNAGSTGLSIVSGSVSGGANGISASHYGGGALSIIANGDVEGPDNTGIYARNFDSNSTALSIVTRGVTGGSLGIHASNSGTGALTIAANGNVVGGNDIGIFADNGNGFDASGLGLGITAQKVTGGQFGIVGRSYSAGAVSIVANGDVLGISTTGIYAKSNGVDVDGNSLTIIAEAVAGGVVGIDARNYGAGALRIVANGDAIGIGGVGIYAKQTNGSPPATVTVGSGATAAGGIAGVRFEEGQANTLLNHGSVRNLAGIGGTAIIGGAGSETVQNFGVVTGNVTLGAGTNAFNNMAGGLFNSGAVVDLGSGNLLTNHGTLAPGGTSKVLTTALTGDLIQPGSAFAVDIAGAHADRVNVSGGASMAGLVLPKLLNLDGTTRWTIMTSASGPIDNGVSVPDTLFVDYELLFPSATEMVLGIESVDFALEGLNRNETAIAENLNAIFKAGDFASLEPMMTALANLPSLGALANALDQLSPEIYLDQQIATLFSSLAFTNSLMTCPVRDGAAAYITEGQCVWARVSGRDFDQDQTFQTLGFEETSFEVAGGLQGALGEVWRLGFAGGYEHGSLDTGETFATSDLDRAHAGAVLKYNPGKLLLATAVSGGWGWYDTERPIAFTGFSATPKAENEIGYVDGRFRAEYQLGGGGFYAKPMVDLDATRINLDGVSESGAGGAGLRVKGDDHTVLSATPALELGTQFGGPAGTVIRPYIRGGATFFDDPDFVLLASFEGSPSGVGPFRIATATDDVVGNVSAGFDVIGTDGASFRLYYDGRFGDLVEEHAGGIKGTLPF